MAVARFARMGLNRGLRQGSRPWLVVGLAATTVRIVGRVVARREETVFRAELHPGAGLQIRALEPEPKRGRHARRAAKSADGRGS